MEHMEAMFSAEHAETLVEGWSARKDVLGEPVYNDLKEKIGTIDDVIITTDQCVSFAIIGVGGFLGISKNDVAIPMQTLDFENGAFVLTGATKEQLKALPKFEYASEEEKRPH